MNKIDRKIINKIEQSKAGKAEILKWLKSKVRHSVLVVDAINRPVLKVNQPVLEEVEQPVSEEVEQVNDKPKRKQKRKKSKKFYDE